MTNRAVCYLRSSKDRNDVSIDAQRRQLHELAMQRGLVIVNEFADAVESGKDDDRPGFQAMIHAIEQKDRGWEHILTLDTSRISRRVFISAAFEHDCEKHRIGVIYKNLPEMEPAELLLFKTVMQGMDHYHSLKSRAKGLAGMAENVRQGWRAGGRAPRGYQLEYTATGAMREGMPVTKSKLVVGEDAEIVSLYLKSRARGESRGAVMSRLKIAWPMTSLIGMEWQALTYAGHTVWNVHAERDGTSYVGGAKRRPRAEWVMTRNTHEPLITDDEAEKILAALEFSRERKTRTTAREYLLSGLLVTRDGTQWHGDDGNCYRVGKGKRISAPRVDNTVLDRIKADLTSDAAIARIADSLKSAADAPADRRRIPAIENRLGAITAKIGRLVDLTATVEDPAPYLRRVAEMEAERAGLRDELETLRTSVAQEARKPQFGEAEIRLMLDALWRDLSEKQDASEIRVVLRDMVDRVELEPGQDTVSIHYRIPVAPVNSTDTTGVILASPRGTEQFPAFETLSRAQVPHNRRRA